MLWLLALLLLYAITGDLFLSAFWVGVCWLFTRGDDTDTTDAQRGGEADHGGF